MRAALLLPGLAAAALVAAPAAAAPALAMICDFAAHTPQDHELVTVEQASGRERGAASPRIFHRGEAAAVDTLIIKPGHTGDCIFPSGRRVRLKVGIAATGTGEGCTPLLFASLWVDRRKVASRITFAGGCPVESAAVAVSLVVRGGAGASASIQRCHVSLPPAGSGRRQPEPVSVCVDHPELQRYAIDHLEYPRTGNGNRRPSPGDIERISGAHAVCTPVQALLRADFSRFHDLHGGRATSAAGDLRFPAWRKSAAPPPALPEARESRFDLDNDGRIETVWGQRFDTRDQQGTVLFGAANAASPRVLPCQLALPQATVRDCLPLAREHDEAVIRAPARGRPAEILFRLRYAAITPFSYRGLTYLGLASHSIDSIDYVAVYQPRPEGQPQLQCLFRRAPEHF